MPFDSKCYGDDAHAAFTIGKVVEQYKRIEFDKILLICRVQKR